MSVKRYVLKVYETFRPLVVPYYKSMVDEGAIKPADIALTLYEIFRVNYKLRDDTLYGPPKIGLIDLSEIGFNGKGKLSVDIVSAYGILEETLRLVPYIVDADDVKYTNIRYSRLLANNDTPEGVAYKLERAFVNSIVEASIRYFIDRDEYIVEVKYAYPIARNMSLLGSMFLFSVALALQNGLNSLIVDYYIETEDDHNLVGYFEYIRYSIFYESVRTWLIL